MMSHDDRKNDRKIGLAFRLLASKKRIVTTLVTIFISALACALFALAWSGWCYDYCDLATRGYLHYAASKTGSYAADEPYPYFSLDTAGEYPYLCLSPSGTISNSIVNRHRFSFEQMRAIEEDTQIPFVREMVNTEGVSYWGCYAGATLPNSLSTVPNADAVHDLLTAWRLTNGTAGSLELAGSEEDYSAMGFTLLAGRYPRSRYEVALSEAHYEAFAAQGYIDVSARFTTEIDDDFGTYNLKYDVARQPDVPVQPIGQYEDLLGKTLMGWSDELPHLRTFTIVGVVDTHCNVRRAQDDWENYPAGRILRAEETGIEVCRAFCPRLDEGRASRLFKLCDAYQKEALEAERLSGESIDYPLPLRGDFFDFSRPEWVYVDTSANVIYSCTLSVGALSAAVGFVALLLGGFRTERMVEDREKEFGILRSMGASDGTIFKILLADIAAMACAIFLVALAASLGMYYAWIRPWGYSAFMDAYELVYNGWTVLILFGGSAVLAMLAAVFPVCRLLRRSVMENIVGRREGKKKKKRK